MANTQKIIIKLRSGATNYSGVLEQGESFYNTSTTKFYIGDGKTATDNLPYFLNNNTGVTLDTNQTVSGKKTFSSDITAKTFVKSGATSEDILLGDGTTKSINDFSESGHKHTVTTDGSVQSVFTGSSSTINANYTPEGSVNVIVNSTQNSNYTPQGSVSVGSITPTGTISADFQGKSTEVSIDYTPSGSISAPNLNISMNNENINTISSVGTSPSMSTSYEEGGRLVFSFDKGTLPSITTKSVSTGVKSATMDDLVFTGGAATLKTAVTPTGNIVNTQFSGNSITPSASFSGTQDSISANFSGTKGTATGSFTPSGSVQSTFEGVEVETSSDK